MANIRKAKINGKLMEVVDIEEYVNHKDSYNPSYTAIEYCGTLLPILPQNSTDIGITINKNCPVNIANKPKRNDKQYSKDNIIDFSDVDSIKSMIEKQETIRKLENDILSTPDNITKFKIGVDDGPEMVALKTVVNKKCIDLDKYEPRFGSNYNNDKRLFNKPNVSLPMLKRICNALDIKSTLILEDAYEGVPNPIGDTIAVTLTGGDVDE